MLLHFVGDIVGRETFLSLKGLVSSYNLKSFEVILRDVLPTLWMAMVSWPSGCRRSGRLIITIGEIADALNGELARGLWSGDGGHRGDEGK